MDQQEKKGGGQEKMKKEKIAPGCVNKTRSEVCRLFLASLQLAAEGNVHILNNEPGTASAADAADTADGCAVVMPLYKMISSTSTFAGEDYSH